MLPPEGELFSSSKSDASLQEALRIINALAEKGFVAYLAGGCVRDAMLGRKPKDFDVATNATPESVREVFGKKNTLAFGASFGVIGVLPPRNSNELRTSNEPQELLPTEVATFRSDGDYSDGRRPDSVHYGDAKADALRRDFTINGMFYDPRQSAVIDYVGGKDDLQSGNLRTIGRAADRFAEDKLRMLRAVRFATTLGFSIEQSTREAIGAHASEITVVSGERIGAEMRRVIVSAHAVDGLQKLALCELAELILPEVNYHDLDGLRTHTDQLATRDFESVMAVLLIASSIDTQSGMSNLNAITKRWKLSNEEVRRTAAAIKHWAVIADEQQPWSVVQPVLINRDADVIVNVACALARSRAMALTGIERAKDALGWDAEKLNPAPLLTGDDLARLGFKPGPVFAEILAATRRDQLDGKISTQNEAIALAKQILDQRD